MLTSVVPQSLSRLVVSLAKSTVLDSPDRAMSSDTCRVVLELWKRKNLQETSKYNRLSHRREKHS